MELNFSELDNQESKQNYWEQNNQNNQNVKKKKFTYDDILSSLNLVVHNGVLQYMHLKPNEQLNLKNDNQMEQPSLKSGKPSGKKNVNMDPLPKNSYIFNKYFKNFKEEEEKEEPQIPKTKEEYDKMVLENFLKRQEERKRIAQIKSRKMFYVDNHNNNFRQNIQPMNNGHNLNKLLFKF